MIRAVLAAEHTDLPLERAIHLRLEFIVFVTASILR